MMIMHLNKLRTISITKSRILDEVVCLQLFRHYEYTNAVLSELAAPDQTGLLPLKQSVSRVHKIGAEAR